MKNTPEHIDQVLEGCKKGDRRSQELLYRSYYQSMVSICIRYTKNENDAVEVLNTGFLKVFRNIRNYQEDKATLYTWIRTIVINSCLDFIKMSGRIGRSMELEEADTLQVYPDVFEKIRNTELLALIRKLPPATQAVFNLSVIEGFSHKEIASQLNISEGTSKWHVSEARKTLQKLIHQQDIKIYE